MFSNISCNDFLMLFLWFSHDLPMSRRPLQSQTWIIPSLRTRAYICALWGLASVVDRHRSYDHPTLNQATSQESYEKIIGKLLGHSYCFWVAGKLCRILLLHFGIKQELDQQYQVLNFQFKPTAPVKHYASTPQDRC